MGNLDLQSMANAIRILSADSIEYAKSGHPGLPLGMADVVTVLFSKFLKFNPSHPEWINRDRFILSAGHGSMLLYSVLHLTGYQDITIEQLKNFRQLHSLTPGHPEVGLTPGVETTTGPLGQGLGNAVGMAMAERIMNARWGNNIVNHNTYCVVGDGCLMEGLSQEAISIAGHFKLNKLVVFWDSNEITIDGNTSLSMSDDYIKRFEGCNWNVKVIDGHNFTEIEHAIASALTSTKPTLIACKTTIGKGAPNKEGSAQCHGAPLGGEEIENMRKSFRWSHKPFEIPEHIYNNWRMASRNGIISRSEWLLHFSELTNDEQNELMRTVAGDLPEKLEDELQKLKKLLTTTKPNWATRKASGEVLAILSKNVPELLGGSADLTESVCTKTSNMTTVTPDNWQGQYIHWGIREHGMAAAMNGLSLYGGIIPYSGTFLSFVDYMRPSVRLAALMKKRVIFVLTHDSIGVGEDGPTHQPTEILAGLRIMPNLKVYRPCDPIETLECWHLAIADKTSPAAIILTRQNLPFVRNDFVEENLSSRGAYVISEALNSERDVTIFATGSEVFVALRAKEILKNEGIESAVISMPCWNLFDLQDQTYKDQILGGDSVRIAVEASISPTWEKYIGTNGAFVGLKDFGLSAPGPILFEYFGITAEKVAQKAREKLKEKRENLAILSKMLYRVRK
ncbi:MAG: transketolase [Richelia sp. RM2_1_2]|nr:transketolase [Richelia sp. RM2_1_2]